MTMYRGRTASMIVPALLGIAALSETTPAVANISHRMNPPGMPIMPEDGTESVSMPMRSDIGRGIQPLRGGGSHPTPAQEERSNSGPFRVLTGVIAYTDPKQGFAIIGNSVDNTFVVRPGQQLPD